MKNRSLKNNKKQIDEFVKCALEQKYCLYAVTLTYRQKKYSYKKKGNIYFKLPKQRLAINKDMKKFNDGFTKYCKRKGIILEYLFVYSRHKERHKKRHGYYNDKIENPHFHGMIALSKVKFLDKQIRKYWGLGNIHISRIKEIDDIYRWKEYMKINIDDSLKYYEDGKKIISRTMKKCTTYEKIDF